PAIVEVSDSDGIDATNERLMFDALETHPTIEAVYSVGGGNTAMVAEVEAVPCLLPMTSMPTTGDCCAQAASRWCCTTICAPTRGSRCGWSRPSGGPFRAGRPAHTSSH